MERILSDDEQNNSPTPNASFILLEARDSQADDAADVAAVRQGGNAAAASRATPNDAQRHPLQYNLQQQQQRRTSSPQHAGGTRQAPPQPTGQYSYELGSNSSQQLQAAPQPQRAATVGSLNSFQRRARNDSMHDLFPIMNSSVFTTPENIMPSLQDAIVIDEVHPHHHHGSLASFQSTTNNLTLNQNALTANQLSLGAIFTAGNNNSFSIARSRDPSCHSFTDQNPRASSNNSLSDTLQTNASFTLRTSPKEWLESLYSRFTTNWDSYFLLFTLVLSIAAVPIAVACAAVLASRADKGYNAYCQLPYPELASGEYEATTASIATITIPALNHVVMFFISLWIAIRCSSSRKRVLRSTAPQSARTNLTSAFMLPCYEAIWYMIAILSFMGVVLYGVSYRQVAKSSPAGVVTTNRDAPYPCNVTVLPLVWILQLLPMLMAQRSVSQEAVVRAIVYSGAVCVVVLVLFLSLFHEGSDAINAVSIAVHFLLFCFYFWAKFFFCARSTFDFFFLSGVVGVLASIVVHVMDLMNMNGTQPVFVGHCVVNSLYALTTVAILLSLRADTRYWLGIDDGTVRTRNPMRQYMRQLSERGMLTNFSTRTSVYDVHRMIEEHRKNVVDFSALKLAGIIAQGATSIVMRGQLRGNIDIALKIYTSVQVTNEELHRFSRETALNVQLSHPNIVKFHGLCVVPPSISLVFEFCEYGGLDVALQNSSLWGLSTKLKAWLDACKAVAYLHSFSPPLLHRDIKTDNFLLGQDYLLKLADFGEANLLRPRTDGTMTIAGTVDYMAPEMILGGKTARYGTAVDTYSLMITLWQIMVPDRSPWDGKTHLEVYTCVKDGERPPLLPSIPQGCAEILESGWAANPMERVAVEELIPKVHKLWLLSLHQKMLKRTS